ncbi:MAG: glycosyltransferase family 4 protein [Acidimicrobiia bacterium]|nr:glycosyltransferase family 4 protein [Acidimicrobiia bacterium]
MLAPITHRTPPDGYGPWEQIAANLTEGLVRAGHSVTVFAPEGSETSGELVPTVPHSLAGWPASEPAPDHRVWEEIHIATMAEHVVSGSYDAVHSHLHVHALGYARLIPIPIVTTLHGVAWNRATHPALARHADEPFVSISDAERAFFPTLNYVATVYNGIDCEKFVVGRGQGEYLLFAGRMAPEKAPHLAVEVALRAGRPLLLAGMVEDRHRGYFESKVLPMTRHSEVEYVGSLNRVELAQLYGDAAAVVMPLAWDEPFGLVAAEALASGTPVIGWARGALPELIQNGVTGAVVNDVNDAVGAVMRIDTFDRAECRRDAVRRFSVAAMTQGYLAAYAGAIEMRSDRRRTAQVMASITTASPTVATRTTRSENP